MNFVWMWYIVGSGIFVFCVWFFCGVFDEEVVGFVYFMGYVFVEGMKCCDWFQLVVDLEDQGMLFLIFGFFEFFGLLFDGMVLDWWCGIDWVLELIFELIFIVECVEWFCQQMIVEFDLFFDQFDVFIGWCFLKQLYFGYLVGWVIQGDWQVLVFFLFEYCCVFYCFVFEC